MTARIAADPETLVPEPRAAFISDDAIDILVFAVQSLEEGRAAALITLVEIRGGAARPLGAQMVVRDDGFYCGFVSGGCTEAAIAAEAMIALRKGKDRHLSLGEGSPFFDIVLPCGGGITLAIHVLADAAVLRQALAAFDHRTPVCLCYHPGKRLLSLRNGGGASGWDGEWFVRAYRAKPRIVVAGTPLEVGALCRVAVAAGYETLTLERGQVPPPGELDADTAVALLFHDIDRELPVLNAALASDVFYVGALGSRRTHAKRCAALLACGQAESVLGRIKAPIGIFDKARDARALAISVVADIAYARARQESACDPNSHR